MATSSGSSVPVFGGKIETYVERLESYFEFHGTAEGKKKHVLIMGLSEAQYETLSSLTSPQKPKEKNYNDLVTLLESHFGTATNKMVERAKFRGVRRTDSESVTDYVVRLRTQARTCEFGTMLDENLVEQFCIGVNSKAVRDRVAAMATEQQNNLKEVIKVALQVEVHEKIDKSSNNDQPETVGAVSHVRSKVKPNQKCFRCSKFGHMSYSKECPAISRSCNDCKKKGHYAGSRFCKGKSFKENVNTVENPSEAHTVWKDDSNYLFTVQRISTQIPKCNLSILGETVQFIIDTGACANIIDIETYNKLKQTGQITLESIDQQGLLAYGSVKQLDILGKFCADVYCNSKHAKAEFYVFNGVAKCLLSFKTTTSLSLISCSDNVVCSVLPEAPKEVTDSFPEVFQGLEKLRGYTAKFHIDENTQPVAQSVGSQNEVKLDGLVENDANPLSRIVTRLDYVPLIDTVVGDSFAESVAKESLP
ncbi:hypothetical protein EB796_017164 [Bugula neritina]|uniref:Retrotransposon gag domain-containing protein n=1 Tax=Bugula neritina TaxID=10212 RepID=A0A7J7JFW1_BUGNE|nr:hypothetical protein EB796_017164 [Bugula neritina]